MKVPFAGAALSGEHQRSLAVPAELGGQGDPIGDAQLRAQVRDHPANGMFPAPEMKTPFPPLAIAVGAALPLKEQPGQRHLPAGKDPQVTMERQYPLFGPHGQRRAHSNRFLPDPAEPFADPPLA